MKIGKPPVAVTARWGLTLTLALLAWVYLVRTVVLTAQQRIDAVLPVGSPPVDITLIFHGISVVSVGVAYLILGYWVAAPSKRPPYNSPPILVPEPKLPWMLIAILLMLGVSAVLVLVQGGITTVEPSRPLPFKLIGILTYTRLLVFPIVLAWFAACSRGKAKWVVAIGIAVECLLASFVSGSRLIAILHTLPLALIGWPLVGRSLGVMMVGILSINVATRSRHLFLPTVAEGSTMTAVYTTTADISAARDTATGVSLPLQYLVDRALGLPELLTILRIDAICPSLNASITHSISGLLSGLITESSCLAVSELYQLPPGSYGGLNLDLIGGNWYLSGGNWILFAVVSVVVGLLSGISVRVGRALGAALGVPILSWLVVVMTLALIFDRRFAVAIGFMVLLGLIVLILRLRASQPILCSSAQSVSGRRFG